jgi:hypothetical protein
MLEGCVKQLKFGISMLLLLLLALIMLTVVSSGSNVLAGNRRPFHVQLPTAGGTSTSQVQICTVACA